MDQDPTVLLIDEDPAAIDSIRRVLGGEASRFKLRRVADVATALARIRGGGIDMVLMNLPVVGTSGDNRLAPLLELKAKALSVPVVVLCSSADENLAEAAMKEGAADYLLREAFDRDLLRVLRSVAVKTGLVSATPRPLTPSGKGGKIVAFMGSNGGVGATTAALNVAAALAPRRRVILVELHSELGSLPFYFHPHRSIKDIGDLLHASPRAEEIPLGEMESCLWPVKHLPGLKVLYGSRSQQNSAAPRAPHEMP